MPKSSICKTHHSLVILWKNEGDDSLHNSLTVKELQVMYEIWFIIHRDGIFFFICRRKENPCMRGGKLHAKKLA